MAKDNNNNNNRTVCCALFLIAVIVAAGLGIIGWKIVYPAIENNNNKSTPPPPADTTYSGPWYNDPSNLNFYYPLDGTYADESGHTTSALAVPGVVAGCISFATSGPVGQQVWTETCETPRQGILITPNNLNTIVLTPNYTLSLLYRIVDSDSQFYYILVGGYNETATIDTFQLNVGTQGVDSDIGYGYFWAYTFELIHGSSMVVEVYGTPDTTPELYTGSWIHVVATYDASLNVGNIYLNGQQLHNYAPATPATSWSSPNTTRPNPILGNWDYSLYDNSVLVGSLSSVRCFNSALNQSAITEVYTVDTQTYVPDNNYPGSTGLSLCNPATYNTGGFFNDPANLNFRYMLGGDYTDYTCRTTASLLQTSGGSCVGFQLATVNTQYAGWPNGAAWYQLCSTSSQGIQLTSSSSSAQIMTQTFSVSLMFFLQTGSPAGTQTLIGSETSSSPSFQLRYRKTLYTISNVPYSFIDFLIDGTVVASTVTYSEQLVVGGLANTWIHVVATLAPTNNIANLYLNGELVVSNTSVRAGTLSSWLSSSSLPSPVIGAQGFAGYISSVRGFNIALSLAQVQTLYKADVPFAWYEQTGLYYAYPLMFNYLDYTGNSRVSGMINQPTSCVPQFSAVTIPNGQQGTSWRNPCDIIGQGLQLTRNDGAANYMPTTFTITFLYNLDPISRYTTIPTAPNYFSGAATFFGGWTGTNNRLDLNYYLVGQLAAYDWGTVGDPSTGSSYPDGSSNTVTSQCATVNSGYVTNKWVHVTLVGDGVQSMQFYLNGALNCSTTISYSFTLWNQTRPQLYIGGYTAQVNQTVSVVGYMNRFRVFNYQMSAAQVAILYKLDVM